MQNSYCVLKMVLSEIITVQGLSGRPILPEPLGSFIIGLKKGALGTYRVGDIEAYNRALRAALRMDDDVGERVRTFQLNSDIADISVDALTCECLLKMGFRLAWYLRPCRRCLWNPSKLSYLPYSVFQLHLQHRNKSLMKHNKAHETNAQL